ncbi:MAG: hypothetical protein H6873_04000 [Hyphomicrobiaceae bacterium]|nr:hypothetical protein [Hyphomicrobiaceae bacterium]
MIGSIGPAEWSETVDPDTGRRLKFLTGGVSNDYSLYYFVPSITGDGRYLVFHGERNGTVQLYRIDLGSGEIGQLTDGHTKDSGWAIWCEWHLDGICAHLSAIHPHTNEVYYFEDDQLRATRVSDFANRLICRLPAGRMPIGQAAFSPDGKWFGYIHADEALYRNLLADRERRTLSGQYSWEREHHQIFRNAIGATLALVDTATGEGRDIYAADFHFHHVLFIDNDTILLNHPRGSAGMVSLKRDGSDLKHLRPPEAKGAHGAMVNHQVITERGIAYEAVAYAPGDGATYLGMYDPKSGRFSERRMPMKGYMHVGFDPLGTFDFVECSGDKHELLAVLPESNPDGSARTLTIRRLWSPDHDHQRFHAHPYMAGSDRQWLYFTDLSEQGFARICAVDVSDLTR